MVINVNGVLNMHKYAKLFFVMKLIYTIFLSGTLG